MWVVELKPFRSLHYNLNKVGGITNVVTLPYDIITPRKQAQYYRQSEYSFIRLILRIDEEGEGPEEKYEKAGQLLKKWIKDKILVEDDKECLYIYDQEYMLNGKKTSQPGIIGLVGIETFEGGNILPHEQIYHKEFKDRYNLLDKTEACLENIISLYSDDAQDSVEKIMRKHMSEKPILDFKHEDDIRHRIWKISDKEEIKIIVDVMGKTTLIIADGHHRYTTALKYYTDTCKEKFKYIMMLLWKMDDKLKILPTHRMLRADKENVKKTLADNFTFQNGINTLDELTKEMDDSEAHVFGMYDGQYHLLTLKDGDRLDTICDKTKSKKWNRLDTNLLRKLVIEPLLGEDTAEAISNGMLKFVKDAKIAVAEVDAKEYDMIFLLKPTTIQEIKDVVEAGERMPQKSTYFYPKPLSGVIMCKL